MYQKLGKSNDPVRIKAVNGTSYYILYICCGTSINDGLGISS